LKHLYSETPEFDLPQISTFKDLGSCEVCPKLDEEIVSLKSKIEQASNAPTVFAKF